VRSGRGTSVVVAALLATGCALSPGGDGPTATAPTDVPTGVATVSPTSPTDAPSPLPSGTPAPSPSPDHPGTQPEVGGSEADRAPPGGASPRGDGAPVVRQGRVVDVVDGDTLDLADGTRVRIAVVDTPEVFGGAEPCGPEAAAFTAAFVAGRPVALYRPVGAPATDPFDRTLGEVVRVEDGASLNVALVAAGLGTVDERFADEDPDLARRARAAADGAPRPPCADPAEPPTVDGDAAGAVVIARVREDGPGNDVEQYGDSEFVELANGGDADVEVSGWSIVDAAGNSVTIGRGFTVRAGGRFRVYSGAGDDVADAAWFAGRSQAYLNNSGGDDLRLLDAAGRVVDTFSF